MKNKRKKAHRRTASTLTLYSYRLLVFDVLAFLAKVAANRKLGVQTRRVLELLVRQLGLKLQQVVVNQADIARALKMKQQYVSRAIGRLVKKGVIIRGASVGCHYAYSLNPALPDPT